MAVRKLKDDKGREYDVEVPDDQDDSDDDNDDGDESDTIYLDEEDIEWLRRKRREEVEAERTSASAKKPTKTGSSGKVVKIRAKQQQSTGSHSGTTRKRTLRLA